MTVLSPPSSAWIDGAATPTIVASSRSMISAVSTAASASQRRRYRGGPGAVAISLMKTPVLERCSLTNIVLLANAVLVN
jgi:hypothetical protein